LLRADADTVLARLLTSAPRTFRTTIITNVSASSVEVLERVTEAGATTEQTRNLGLTYPRDALSLSHLTLTSPLKDWLYRLQHEANDEDYGVNLGSMATRGERGALIVSLDSLFRMSSNTFFPYMMERIEEGLGRGVQAAPAK
jgi:hypothetical protein